MALQRSGAETSFIVQISKQTIFERDHFLCCCSCAIAVIILQPASSRAQSGQSVVHAQPRPTVGGSPLSESRCAADNRNEARRFVSPADFFSRQSLNASRMTGRPNTRHRFQQQNALFDDLLLSESERDGAQTTLTIRGMAIATNLSH
uniref:Uncharacterized protein n=1 Tax=Globodera rostochiensis TaxID=31243 RepID=A0A914HUQ9_GLORO